VLLTSCLRLHGTTDFLLALYLVAFSLVVVIELLLSPGHHLTAAWLSAALAVTAVVSGVVWVLRGRPAPPPSRPALTACRDAARDPLVAILGVAVLCGLAYASALIVGTAPNDYDALWYHLARGAFWKQQHAIAYIPRANDARLNSFPPNAEIADSFTMILGRTERFVGFVQLSALMAATVAVGGIARRIGLSVRQALFGAFLFASLPDVVLQSSTALNDLVLAAFLLCSAYFLFTWTRLSLALAAVALGLAIGTKLTALLGLPLLAVLGAVLYPRRRWPALLLVGAAGAALGSYWYLFNLAETGRLGGRFGPEAQQDVFVQKGNTHSLGGTVAHFMHLLIDSVDPSGAVGRDRFLYLVAAAVVLVLGSRGRRRFASVSVTVATALAALPLAFEAINHELLHAYQKVWVSLDHPNLAFLGYGKQVTAASPSQSWYGAAGFLLVLGGFALVWIGIRRDTLPRLAIVLALAPVVWLVLQAVTTFYTVLDGRYAIFGVALAAAVWGLLLPYRQLAWAAAAVAVTGLALVLVHYDEKPSGVNVLGGSAPTSVWDMSRAQVQRKFLHKGETDVLSTLEKRAKKGQTIALAIRREDASYPYFGSSLDRRVVFTGDLRSGAVRQTPAGATWLVLAPHFSLGSAHSARDVSPSWRRVAGGHGWELYRHV
jgi:Dolichyl-phosphate-mannose-protein mannosyltransferase